ncbi:unnamed protein product [Amoebophrya sp. A120]|nr:unnamed protein product [Amoebophrya sp. A120]|eukprot:GSA120T00003886001.1
MVFLNSRPKIYRHTRIFLIAILAAVSLRLGAPYQASAAYFGRGAGSLSGERVDAPYGNNSPWVSLTSSFEASRHAAEPVRPTNSTKKAEVLHTLGELGGLGANQPRPTKSVRFIERANERSRTRGSTSSKGNGSITSRTFENKRARSSSDETTQEGSVCGSSGSSWDGGNNGDIAADLDRETEYEKRMREIQQGANSSGSCLGIDSCRAALSLVFPSSSGGRPANAAAAQEQQLSSIHSPRGPRQRPSLRSLSVEPQPEERRWRAQELQGPVGTPGKDSRVPSKSNAQVALSERVEEQAILPSFSDSLLAFVAQRTALATPPTSPAGHSTEDAQVAPTSTFRELHRSGAFPRFRGANAHVNTTPNDKDDSDVDSEYYRRVYINIYNREAACHEPPPGQYIPGHRSPASSAHQMYTSAQNDSEPEEVVIPKPCRTTTPPTDATLKPQKQGTTTLADLMCESIVGPPCLFSRTATSPRGSPPVRNLIAPSNGCAKALAFAYHSAIQVDGDKEMFFGAGGLSDWREPLWRRNKMKRLTALPKYFPAPSANVFVQVDVGMLPHNQVTRTLEAMRNLAEQGIDWTYDKYDLLSKNCNHFTVAFLENLFAALQDAASGSGAAQEDAVDTLSQADRTRGTRPSPPRLRSSRRSSSKDGDSTSTGTGTGTGTAASSRLVVSAASTAELDRTMFPLVARTKEEDLYNRGSGLRRFGDSCSNHEQPLSLYTRTASAESARRSGGKRREGENCSSTTSAGLFSVVGWPFAAEDVEEVEPGLPGGAVDLGTRFGRSDVRSTSRRATTATPAEIGKHHFCQRGREASEEVGGNKRTEVTEVDDANPLEKNRLVCGSVEGGGRGPCASSTALEVDPDNQLYYFDALSGRDLKFILTGFTDCLQKQAPFAYRFAGVCVNMFQTAEDFWMLMCGGFSLSSAGNSTTHQQGVVADALGSPRSASI